jgi:S-adenosylmethionine-diacylglycerol 3-amino-3-carboxypropyl transferase
MHRSASSVAFWPAISEAALEDPLPRETCTSARLTRLPLQCNHSLKVTELVPVSIEARSAKEASHACFSSRPADHDRLDWLFKRVFDGLVYNHVWEDPLVDIEALALRNDHCLVSIASAGCNLLAYLSCDLKELHAVDTNRAHLAVSHLKRTAFKTLPSFEDFFQFFGCGRGLQNIAAYDGHIRQHLDPDVRAYWDGRTPMHGRRIDMFAQGFYRHGLLSRSIGLVKFLARNTGRDISQLVTARDLDHQHLLFEQLIAPLFCNRLVNWISRFPISLFTLGVPPNQYFELDRSAKGNLVGLLRERIRRLACDFPIADNYFAWLAFAGHYDMRHRRAVPPYLQPEVFAKIRDRVDRIQLHATSITDFLASRTANSVHRFVLLDSQDWMNDEDLVALWTQINRTADLADAIVIFRTAGNESPVRKLPESLRSHWNYRESKSRQLHQADRSSIYGGFHVYARRPAADERRITNSSGEPSMNAA